MQRTIIDGVEITYDEPWLIINGRQLQPEEIVALATFFQRTDGRAVADALRAERDGHQERTAAR